MSKELVEKFAGELLGEIEESDKMIPSEQKNVMAESHTAMCGVFFTIYCC